MKTKGVLGCMNFQVWWIYWYIWKYSFSPVSRCGWFKGCRRLSWTALGSLKVLLSLSYYSSYNISAKGEMRMLWWCQDRYVNFSKKVFTKSPIISWHEWKLSMTHWLTHWVRLTKLYTGYMALGYIARHTWLYSHWLYSHVYMAI